MPCFRCHFEARSGRHHAMAPPWQKHNRLKPLLITFFIFVVVLLRALWYGDLDQHNSAICSAAGSSMEKSIS
jgi:hypothetical protein